MSPGLRTGAFTFGGRAEAPSVTRHVPASEHRLLLTIGDLLAGALAVAIALALWSLTAGFPLQVSFMWSHAAWLAAAPVWAMALVATRHARVAFSMGETARGIARATLGLLVVYLVVYFYAPRQVLPRLMVLHVLWQASVLTFAWRLVYIWVFTETSFRRKVVIVGAGQAGRALLGAYRQAGLRHVDVVAFVDEAREADAVEGLPLLSPAADLRAIARHAGASEVVVALDRPAAGAVVQALVGCQEDGADVVQMATAYERLLERVPVEHLEPDWLVTSFADAVTARDASRVAKRLLDLAGAALGLAVLLVTLPVIGAAIWLDSGGPIFFSQERVGQRDRLFRLLKFRTMVRGAEPEGQAVWASPGDQRVTRVGRWLRRPRLDELPQVVNVLLGDMSLVGPRPERPDFVAELERRIPFYRTRLLVRPGLTGWAQVNMPYAGSVEDALVKLEYDLYYIKHRSLMFDGRVLLRTLGTVLRLGGR